LLVAKPSRKLATSSPVLALMVQPLASPAQLEVWLLVNAKLPTMVSALRISRERSVRLPPTLTVCLPFSQVTLSKNWKSFWLVISGWLPFAPRFRIVWNPSWVIADVA
jgi:hypothetical protein